MSTPIYLPSFLKKLVYPAILLVLGVGSNSWILGGQLDCMEGRKGEKFETMGERFKKVEGDIGTVMTNVSNLTKRQTEMEGHDMKAVQKLLQDCRQKR